MKPAAYSYKHPRPALTADCAVFAFDGEALQLLLVKRSNDPYKGKWALPGGFLHDSEDSDACASRVLREKAGVKNIFFEQLYTFSDPDRDPRGWVVSVAHYALVKLEDVRLEKGTDEAEWFPVSKLPALAFDHKKIVNTARARLEGKVRYQPIGFELLPAKFTLTQLQRLYEAILGTQLDKRNFRKKILSMELLKQLDEKQANVSHKPAALFRFDEKKYRSLSAKGFSFEL